MSTTRLGSKTLRSVLTTVTSVARRRMLKPHAGFGQFLEPIIAIYEAHIDVMRIDGADPTQLRAMLASYQSSATEEAAALATLTKIRDQRLQESSTVWSFMLEVYARAQVFARKDSALKQAISDFAAFMRQRPRKSKTTTPTTPPSTTTA